MHFAVAIRNLSRFGVKVVYTCAVLAAVVQLFTVGGWAQSTFGEFLGTVKDPSGALVANCIVTVKNLETSSTRKVTTDSTGSYTVVNLEPGKYDITMEAPGFQAITNPGLQLLARQTVRVDGQLGLATQAQTVEVKVQAEAPINTEVSNIAETKLGRELIDLPVALGSRASGSTSAFSTLTIQPGVETDNSGNISVAGGEHRHAIDEHRRHQHHEPSQQRSDDRAFPLLRWDRRDARQRG